MAKEHHVAWADRVGLNKQWSRDIQACGEAFGTLWYRVMVRRFQNNIPNIKNGPQLRDNIENHIVNDLEHYKRKTLDEWSELYPQESKIEEEVSSKQEEIAMYAAERLYQFIIQLLEDHGFCFYESSIEEDEMS